MPRSISLSSEKSRRLTRIDKIDLSVNASPPTPEKSESAASSPAPRVERKAVAGSVSIVCTCVGVAVLGYLVLQPLPWSHLPNIFRVFKSSWLYLAIASAIVYSAMASVAARRRLPADMAVCLATGLVWKFTGAFSFVPFNLGRLLIVYPELRNSKARDVARF